LPPSTIAHARYLHKRLSARLPELPVIIALWAARVDPEQVAQRFGGRNVEVVTTLEEAVRLIRARAFAGAQRRRAESAAAAPAEPGGRFVAPPRTPAD
jgi:hypothetical protein